MPTSMQIKFIQQINWYIYTEREGKNKSLTQRLSKQSLRHLQDVLEIIQINKNNLMNCTKYTDYQKKIILKHYYDRVMTYEIYPIIKRVLLKSFRDQKKSFHLLNIWISSLNTYLASNIPSIRYFLFKFLNNHLFLVKNLALKDLKVLYKTLNDKQDKKARKAFSSRYPLEYKETLDIINDYSHLSFFILKVKKLYKFVLNRKKIKKQLYKIIYRLSKLLPQNKNKVVLASTKIEFLNGNLLFVNDYLKKNTNFKVVPLLGRQRRFKIEYKKYFHLGTARYIITNDYYNPLYGEKIRKNTDYIQLWHAAGAFKKFGYSALGYRDSNSLNFEKNAHSQYTKVITSSKYVRKNFSEAFNININKVVSTGIPRTDFFFDEEKMNQSMDKLHLKYPSLKGKKVILYAPTFRGNPAERKNFKLHFDWNKLNLPDNSIMLIKLHPAVTKNVSIPEEFDKKIINVSKDNININEFLIIADVLISDYSSIIFEYSLLNKPIIFYAYDLDSYLSERNFYYPFKEYLYGPLVKNTQELSDQLNNLDSVIDLDKIRTFREKFMFNCDGKATERFVENLLHQQVAKSVAESKTNVSLN
ncbi:CDP-glycerol glycerophosphotransferase family protein [Sporolactobacillus sp. THM7-4]|nr:CDP-glycerol glycerophosphotransferase family protein [Sporolactobacillus sp. THM7-4]